MVYSERLESDHQTASLRSAHMHCLLMFPQICRQWENLIDEKLRRIETLGKAAEDVPCMMF